MRVLLSTHWISSVSFSRTSLKKSRNTFSTPPLPHLKINKIDFIKNTKLLIFSFIYGNGKYRKVTLYERHSEYGKKLWPIIKDQRFIEKTFILLDILEDFHAKKLIILIKRMFFRHLYFFHLRKKSF